MWPNWLCSGKGSELKDWMLEQPVKKEGSLIKLMITNKNVCKMYQSNLYFTFSLSESVWTVIMAFADLVFVTFVDTLSAEFIISLHTITESLTILFKFLLFLQIHALGL